MHVPLEQLMKRVTSMLKPTGSFIVVISEQGLSQRQSPSGHGMSLSQQIENINKSGSHQSPLEMALAQPCPRIPNCTFAHSKGSIDRYI